MGLVVLGPCIRPWTACLTAGVEVGSGIGSGATLVYKVHDRVRRWRRLQLVMMCAEVF